MNTRPGWKCEGLPCPELEEHPRQSLSLVQHTVSLQNPVGEEKRPPQTPGIPRTAGDVRREPATRSGVTLVVKPESAKAQQEKSISHQEHEGTSTLGKEQQQSLLIITTGSTEA